MSGWGNKESKTASGTIAVTTAGAVTGVGTSFESEATVGDMIRSGNQEFIIIAIASDTACTVINANPELTWTTINAGASYSLNEKPTSLASDPNSLTTNVFGVDTNEIQVAAATKGIAHAGWVAKTTRGSRTTFETLVALSKNGASPANMGDAEDVVFPDPTTTTTAAPTTTTTAAATTTTTAAPTTTTTAP